MPTFHGMPVSEAKATVYLRATDADKGVKGDPFNCRWANAAKRMYGGMAAFFDTVAYIEIEPGKIVRFEPKMERNGILVTADKTSPYRAGIDGFDAKGTMPNATLMFGPSSPGRTLAARSAENKARYAKRGPRVVAQINSGTGNGKPPRVAARGGYNPQQHIAKPKA